MLCLKYISRVLIFWGLLYDKGRIIQVFAMYTFLIYLKKINNENLNDC